MSLDVSLSITKEKRCPHCNEIISSIEEYIFDANITHNLNIMANHAGIYEACWKPEEIHATKAEDIIPLLEQGLKDLKERPEYFKQFNASNGWGLYEHFVPWVEEYLDACKKYPKAKIHVSR